MNRSKAKMAHQYKHASGLKHTQGIYVHTKSIVKQKNTYIIQYTAECYLKADMYELDMYCNTNTAQICECTLHILLLYVCTDVLLTVSWQGGIVPPPPPWPRFIGLLTAWFPGPCCLNVVDKEIGGTTAMEFHCSGSWPTWIASVANDLWAARKPANSSPFSSRFRSMSAARCLLRR